MGGRASALCPREGFRVVTAEPLSREQLDVATILVNWNCGDDLVRSVKQISLQVGVSNQTIVVDNASVDHSVEGAVKEVQGVLVLSQERNLGYAGGNNVGLAAAMGSARYLLVMNPDVRLEDPTALKRLVDLADRNPTLAAVAPTIRLDGGEIEYCGSEFLPDRAWAVHRPTGLPEWPFSGEVAKMPWIDGAILLIRCSALKMIGMFDERFFLIQEEVDWCARATRLGWEVGVATEVDVRHLRATSFGLSRKAAYYHWRNLALLSHRHANYPVIWSLFWAFRLLNLSVRRTAWRAGIVRAAWLGAADALRGRFGPGPEDGPEAASQPAAS